MKRGIKALWAASCAAGLALTQIAGAVEAAPEAERTALSDELVLEEADTAGQAQALIGRLDLAFGALCTTSENVADFTNVIANESAAFSLDAVILALAQVAGNESLCAPARAAARDAQNLAQFAQAAASSDDATGALGDGGEDAPFSFGGLAAPGGAGYI